ncbi:hypothetical protein H6F89_30075 [Cyanobacteria bacterium FACHB-63]|nr:hypothetical protein [Cyanobacteria bacterium FACHB-63]
MSNSVPPISSAKVQTELVVDAISKLEALPEKTPVQKRELTTRETVSAMYETLCKLRFEKGYSFVEISDLLKEMIGLDVSSKTLQNYFGEETKSRKRLARQRKRRSERSNSQIAPSLASAAPKPGDSTPEQDVTAPSTLAPNSDPDSIAASESPQFDLQQALVEIADENDERNDSSAATAPTASTERSQGKWVEPEFNTIQTRPKKRRGNYS